MKGFWHYVGKGALFLARALGRVLRIALALLIALGIAGFFAARHFFDEDRVRSFLVTRLQDVLGRPVQLGKVVLTPSGVKVSDIRVIERLDVPGQYLLSSELAVVTIRPAALLERRLELGTVRLIKPRLQLVRDADGLWNVADIFLSAGTRRPAAGGPPVTLAAKTVVMEDGDVVVDDRLKSTRYRFFRVNLEVTGFDSAAPFSYKASFENESTVSTRTIASAWELEGDLSLAGYDWRRAFFRATSVRAALDGQTVTGQASIDGFIGAVAELELAVPAVSSEAWHRYLGHPFELNLPESSWRLKLAFPNPRQIEVRQLDFEGGGLAGTASGLLDLSAEPQLSAEVRFTGAPLERLAAVRPSLARFELKGLADGRAALGGPLLKPVVRELEGAVTGLGGLFGRARVTGGDLTFKADDEFSRIAVTAKKGEVEAYGYPFKDIGLTLGLVKGDLKIDDLAFRWTDASVKLKARVQNVTAPKEVVVSGQVDSVDWAEAAKLVGNLIEASRAEAPSRGRAPREWVRVFKYVIPKKFPDSVGEITVGKVRHRNFNFDNMDLLWEIRGVTKQLDRATGDVKVGFGPGRVNDVPAVQDSHKFLKIVFLPFVYMHKMNNLSVFSTATAYPKTLAFNRIEGEYHVQKGAAHTRCFYVDSPQVVAYADGVADFARERVDMNILTRLTTYRDPLPEWWVDERGRPAIGFRVKNDLNRPDLDPRLRKMESDEIETAVAECKAKSKMRFGALDKIRRL